MIKIFPQTIPAKWPIRQIFGHLASRFWLRLRQGRQKDPHIPQRGCSGSFYPPFLVSLQIAVQSGQRFGGWTTKPENQGFTLIELLVVVALIVLITVFALPNLTSYFQLSLNSASRDLASVIKETYNATAMTGQVYRIVYDFKKNEYWSEAGPPNLLLDTKESREKEERRKKFGGKKKEEASPFRMDRSVTRKKISLPMGVKFEDILTQQSPDPIREGIAYTHFFPHGLTERTIIHLVDTQKNKVSLIISPLIGRTELYDRYVTESELNSK